VEQYREFIKYFLWIVDHYGGVRLDPDVTEWVVGLSLAFIGGLSALQGFQAFLMWLRRRFGSKVLPEEHLILKEGVVEDLETAMRRHLESLLADFKESLRETADKNRAAIARSSASIKRKLNEYITVANDNPDTELDREELSDEPGSRKLKRSEAMLQLKDVVLAKYLAGAFVEDENDRHSYKLDSTFSGGTHIELRLQTPYRGLMRDGRRLPYVLEAWFQNTKVLKLEWQEGAGAIIRRCIRRQEWEQLLLDWREDEVHLRSGRVRVA
jgi:hypothetical protein